MRPSHMLLTGNVALADGAVHIRARDDDVNPEEVLWSQWTGSAVVEPFPNSSLEFRRGRADGREGEVFFTRPPFICANISGEAGDALALIVHMLPFSCDSDDWLRGDHAFGDSTTVD